MAQAEVLPIEITGKNNASGAFAQLRRDLDGIKGSIGPLNSALTSTLNLFQGGAGGLAAALGIGAVAKALNLVADAAHGLAQKSLELRNFSEATGFTTAQVQALTSEASKFGLTSDEVQQSVQQFTARFNELRVGQGELLTQIRRINPALADQMAQATDAATAMNLFGQALQQTDNIFERNALMKAATGRGGLRAANLFAGINVEDLTQTYVNAGRALDDNLIKKLAQLDIEITKTSSKAKQNIASIFSEDALQLQLRYEKSLLTFSESAKNFSLSGDLRYLLEMVAKVQIGGPGTLLGKMGIDYKAGYKVPQSGTNLPDIDPFGTFSVGGKYPEPDKTKDPRYVAEQLRAQIGALGDAATYTQKLALAQQDLAIKGKDAGLSEQQLAKASAALNVSFDLQKLQLRTGLLGTIPQINGSNPRPPANDNLPSSGRRP